MSRSLLLASLVATTALASPKPLQLAVSYFDNNTSDPSLDPLARGLADMLITDLSSVQALQLVEREKLNLALDELKLSKTKFVDPKNALKLGKGLAARYLLTGSYLVKDGVMRLDARLFDVVSGKQVFSVGVDGKTDEFFALEKELVEAIIKALDLTLQRSEQSKLRSNPTESFDAFTKYSAGLAAKDAGDDAKAREWFAAALAADPTYRAAKTASERLGAVLQKEGVVRLAEADVARGKLDPKAKDFAQQVEAIVSSLREGHLEEQQRKLALLSWLAENDLTPATNPANSPVAHAAAKVIERHVEDPTQWDALEPACEYVVRSWPRDGAVADTCRDLRRSLAYERQSDRAEKQHDWDEEREHDLAVLAPDDWRISLHKNEAAMRKLIGLYASKVKK